jgi:C4-type Zn-finger protein
MLCPRCHKQMQLVRQANATGSDGSVTEKQWRCVRCWFHETQTEKREKI